MRRLLVLKAGEAAPSLWRAAGDYDQWFGEALAGTSTRLEVLAVHRDVPLPASPRRWSGILMTGSPLSVTRPAPWMRRAARWLLRAAAAGTPVLGVCFGHQLIAAELGVPVLRNPRGREVGTITVHVTPAGRADPLLHDLPSALQVQATHEDIVERLPARAQLLATNRLAPVQAFRAGKALWGVQFHPELSSAGMGALIRARADQLDQEGLEQGVPDRARRLLAGIGPTPDGPKLLRNFALRICNPV